MITIGDGWDNSRSSKSNSSSAAQGSALPNSLSVNPVPTPIRSTSPPRLTAEDGDSHDFVDYFHVELQPSTELLLPLNDIVSVVTVEGKRICPIPGVSTTLLGVVNYQGRLLWVAELSQLLGLGQFLKKLELRRSLALVVVSNTSNDSTHESSQQQVGCIVSALKGIVKINSEQLKPVPAEFPLLSSFVSKVAKVEELPIAILNLNAIFASPMLDNS